MRWCPRCGAWKGLDRTNFYVNSSVKSGFQRQCKACRKSQDTRPDHNARVHLSKIRPWLNALVRRLGWQNAARQLGVTNAMLSRWLGKQVSIQRRYAALVLKTCAEVGVLLPA